MVSAFVRSVCLLVWIGWSGAALAQTPFATKVGDWSISEYETDRGRSTGVPNKADTRALDNRDATLGIDECGPYSVYFHFESNEPEFEKSLAPDLTNLEQVAFYKIDAAKPGPNLDGLPDYGNQLRPMILSRGYMSYFMIYPPPLMAGAKLTICPVADDKHPACVSFSLKGFTAALKAVCPKR